MVDPNLEREINSIIAVPDLVLASASSDPVSSGKATLRNQPTTRATNSSLILKKTHRWSEMECHGRAREALGRSAASIWTALKARALKMLLRLQQTYSPRPSAAQDASFLANSRVLLPSCPSLRNKMPDETAAASLALCLGPVALRGHSWRFEPLAAGLALRSCPSAAPPPRHHSRQPQQVLSCGQLQSDPSVEAAASETKAAQ